MNLRLLSLALLSLLSLPLLAKEGPSAAQPVSILVDFRSSGSSFAYGSFQGKAGGTKDGILVAKAPDGKGGCGADCDLKLGEATWLELGIATLPANEAPAMQIMLEDADGTSVSYRYSIEQLVPGTPAWLRVPLNQGSVFKPGQDGVLSKESIVKWHIQGDYASAKTVQIMVIALRARL